jgi:hypothetical protein
MTLKKLTPIKAIKQYCRFECSANDIISWRECSCVKCPLFPYRLGRRPTTKPFSEYTQKQRDLRLKSPKTEVLQEETGVNNGN